MYTQKQLQRGEGLLVSDHTYIFQRNGEDCFVTGGSSDLPGPGFHLAGGGKLRKGVPFIEWCDLRE